MKRAYLALAAASALTACAPVNDMGGGMENGGQTAMAAGSPIGEPVDCVNVSDIREARPLNDRTIIFRMGSGRIYRNELPNACPDIRFRAFTYRNSGDRLCSVDTIVVTGASRSVPGPTCGLGSFQELERDVR